MEAEQNLNKLARQSYEFVQSEYGEGLVQRMVELHSTLTESAEKAPSLEARGLLITEAAGVKQAIDLILEPARLISSGELARMEKMEQQREKEAADMAAITP